MADRLYEDVLRADRRLVILQLLAQAREGQASARVLRKLLDQAAHPVSHDALRTDIAWLTEQGLVTADDIDGACFVTLVDRGEDVASGRATVPGVSQPSFRRL